MQTILTILVILFAIGAVVALVRGVVAFLRTQHEEIASGGAPSASGLRQNKMMRARIMFQALAVIAAILLLILSRG